MHKAVLARQILAIVVGTPLAAFFGGVFNCDRLLVAGRLDLSDPALAAGLFFLYACLSQQTFGASRVAKLQLAIFLPALSCGLISGLHGLMVSFFPAR